MTTALMSTSQSTTSTDSSPLLTSQTELALQNDQLWCIITQQKNIIRDLELTLARITKDHDLLLLRSSTTTTPATPPSPPTCEQEPVPPPRSPYRQHLQHRSHDNNTVNNNNTVSETAPTKHRSSSSTTKEHASTSSTTAKTGPIHAILDKDAELFANYQKSSNSLTPSTSSASDSGNDKDSNNDNSSNINSSNNHDHDHHNTISKTDTSTSLPSSQTHHIQGTHVMTATDLDTSNYTSFSKIMTLKVVEINIQHTSKNKEAITFIISISRTSASCVNNSEEELWRIKKGYSEFMALDTLLRSRLRSLTNKFNTTTIKMGKLPAKSIFTTAKSGNTNIDQKKRVIERYLTNAIRLPLPENIDLIQFLASGIFEQNERSTRSKQSTCEKEGYVLLYGKQSKKWHSYYFMLRGSMLDYYDSNDGPFIGSILLNDSQMTVQRSSTSGIFHHTSPRSTVTITQAKRSLSSSKHCQQYILRMESETELDEWVQALSVVIQPTPQVSRSECIGASTKINMTGSIGSIRTGSHLPSRKRISNRILPTTTHAPPRSQSDTSVHSGSLTPSITTALGLYQRPLPPTPQQQQEQQQQQRQRKRSSIDAIFYSARRAPALAPAPAPAPVQSPQENHLMPQETQSTRHTSAISALLPSASTSLLTRRHGNDPVATAATKKPAPKLNRRTFWPKSMFLGQGHTGDSTGLRSFLSRHSTTDSLSSSSAPSLYFTANPSPAPSATTTTTTSRLATSATATAAAKHSRLNDHHQPIQHSTSLTKLPSRPVFGVPLEIALQVSKIHGLPSIVYRCIQFLERKKAVYEEGIYRISGSTIKIKGLRRRFDEQGDIDLLALEEFRDCDVHAVSGLLKLWLRELPEHILTAHLIDTFILVKDSKDRDECIKKLHRLIFKLPPANYTLLRALMAHLHCVTRNANVNKMTLRNMGIVFSPTLGIPTNIFDLFLCEFDSLFMPRRRQQQQQQQSRTLKPATVATDAASKNKVTMTNSSAEDDDQPSTTPNNLGFGNSTTIARHHHGKVDRQSGMNQDDGDNSVTGTNGMELVVLDPPRPMIKT